MRILKPVLLYFAIVFGAGFLLGPIRILLLVPRIGVRTSELIEMPVMLAVMLLASRWIDQRFLKSFQLPARVAVGCLALFLMLGAELSLARLLQGLSISDYIAGRDVVSGTVYAILLVVFAILPVFWSSDVHRA